MHNSVLLQFSHLNMLGFDTFGFPYNNTRTITEENMEMLLPDPESD